MLIEKIKPLSWDERRELLIPGDYDMTLAYCVEHFLFLAKEAIKNHGDFFVALSGGSTPNALFERLSISSSISSYDAIDWHKVHVFWSDERSVPPTDKNSNYHMAMESGLKKLPLKQNHIHRMVAESHIEENALAYEKTIKETLKGHPFDLVMLGVGEDGHTASLFPNTEGLYIENRWVIPNYIKEKDTWRMTFTFPFINQATHTVLYVLGASKKQILSQVLKQNAPITFPSQHIGTKERKALWIADEAASSLLKGK